MALLGYPVDLPDVLGLNQQAALIPADGDPRLAAAWSLSDFSRLAPPDTTITAARVTLSDDAEGRWYFSTFSLPPNAGPSTFSLQESFLDLPIKDGRLLIPEPSSAAAFLGALLLGRRRSRMRGRRG